MCLVKSLVYSSRTCHSLATIISPDDSYRSTGRFSRSVCIRPGAGPAKKNLTGCITGQTFYAFICYAFNRWSFAASKARLYWRICSRFPSNLFPRILMRRCFEGSCAEFRFNARDRKFTTLRVFMLGICKPVPVPVQAGPGLTKIFFSSISLCVREN